MTSAPEIIAFFDEATNSVSYLIAGAAHGVAAVIDPVLNFDLASGTVSTRSADRILAAAGERQLRIEWVLETHVHAATLCAPKLLYPAIQVNIRAGRLPPCGPDGSKYLKIPVTIADA